MKTLNNGMEIPDIGLGTCFGSPEEMHQAAQWVGSFLANFHLFNP